MRTIAFPPAFLFAAALVWVCAAIFIGCSGVASIQGHSGEPAGLEAATRLTPLDASSWQRAGLKLLESQPAKARLYLERAIQLNRRDADALVGLGFWYERSGDFTEAESYYRAAAAISRRFKPHYALATYYFRRGQHPQYWESASRAAAIPGSDPQRLFHVSHRITDDAREVRQLLKLDSPQSVSSYFGFLLNQDHLDNLADLAPRLDATGAQREALLSGCERLLRAGRTAEAASLWNRLETEDDPIFSRLDPSGKRLLVNGSFHAGPMRGFNWQSYQTPEIALAFADPSGLRVEFSGKQPETGAIISQPLWLLAASRYQLRYRYELSDLASIDGLQWAILSGNRLSAVAPWVDASEEGVFEFDAPAQPARLIVRYTRPPGAVRLRGSLTLLHADLRRLP